MVIKGSARGGAGELAYHLLRADTNETVRVVTLSGVASLDLRGALAELDAMGAGSRSQRTLYHASINTPIVEQLDPEQQTKARERLAAELGLTGQPFVVVEHVKHGRQHTHVVWSRIDVETGKAIPDSHNYRRHEIVSRELEQEFGHERVLGAHIRDKETEQRPERGPTWAEQRQAERSGLTADAAREIVSGLWRQTTTGREFQQGLADQGFILARGDRRDFVLIDPAGELHGLTRRIEGAKAAEVRQRMADIDINELPGVKEARERQKQLHPTLKPEPDKGFVSASERLKQEEQQREREGGKATRESLSGSHGEIADAIYQLNKTMRPQVAQTIANSQTHRGLRDDQVPAAAPRTGVRSQIENQPAAPAQAEQGLRAKNLIQPLVKEATPQEKSMADVSARIQANVEAARIRDVRAAEKKQAAQKIREASGLPRGSRASPQAIERLDKELGRTASSDRKGAAKPTRSSEPKEILKWNRSKERDGPNLSR